MYSRQTYKTKHIRLNFLELIDFVCICFRKFNIPCLTLIIYFVAAMIALFAHNFVRRYIHFKTNQYFKVQVISDHKCFRIIHNAKK